MKNFIKKHKSGIIKLKKVHSLISLTLLKNLFPQNCVSREIVEKLEAITYKKLLIKSSWVSAYQPNGFIFPILQLSVWL